MGRTLAEPRQRLQYICDLLDQLRAMTPPQVGPMLPHLIDMAKLEASEAMLSLPQGKSETLPPA